MVASGLLNKIYTATLAIDSGRKGFATEARSRGGVFHMKKG